MSEWLEDNTTERARHHAVEFAAGDPVEVFSRLDVYVEFDSDRHGRQPVTTALLGQPGQWVRAYSTMQRLVSACGDPEVEYTYFPGSRLLTMLPGHAGVWFDYQFPGSRPILMPTPELSIDAS